MSGSKVRVRPCGFLEDWEKALHPELAGEPVVRIALVDPDRAPVTHQRVEGVPDEVLTAYYEEGTYEEMELADFVGQHGGVLRKIRSAASSLGETRPREGVRLE